jgi:hypothetical protein
MDKVRGLGYMKRESEKEAQKGLQKTSFKIARVILLIICGINGLSAIISGVLMMMVPDGSLLGMQPLIPEIQKFPFPSYFTQNLFWSGAALGLVNGVPNLIAFEYVRGHTVIKGPYLFGIFCGVLLIAWTIFECIYFPNVLSLIYTAVGHLQIAVAAIALINRPAKKKYNQDGDNGGVPPSQPVGL